ncbi:hypothetical protein Cgig2_004059 [Carnegiea gigantea]|uniref:Bifunctional inhibitor/plant lipid transfer protein/seed storage helical domain-containing protein n=1 Tax=Carnegiea gigantea TaxID=171969 RepID=A0A9Q1KU72_9CARY|nr:hypothetical protein Cgig2_004059 [Carnegiea gigantea]
MGSSGGTKMCTMIMISVALVMTMLWGGALAQSTQQSGCTSQLVGLAPCLGYITGLVTVPSSPCCRQLDSIVQSEPQCLCQLVNSGNSSPLGVAINMNQALSLPGACNLQTPDVSLCKLLNQPTGSGNTGGDTASSGSPSTSPTDDGSTPDSSQTPEVPQTTPSTIAGIPSSTGFKSTTGSTSSGNITKYSVHLTLFLLFIASRMMVKLAIVALVASSMWAVSNAQSGSSDSCTNVLISMSPCLNYITGNSSTPSSSCCTQLESVVKNNPKCLCEVINGGASKLAGININQTQAMGLPMLEGTM